MSECRTVAHCINAGKVDSVRAQMRAQSMQNGPGIFPRPLHFRGGDDGIRTHDPHVANVMLSQLSYIPTKVCAFAQGSSLPDFETIVNRFA